MIDKLIDKVLFMYIVSLYLFTYRPGYNIISNLLAGCFIYLVSIKILIDKKKIRINSFLILFFLFSIICVISYFVAINKSIVVSKVKTLFLNFILVGTLVNYLDNLEKISKLIKYYIYSGFIAATYILLNSNISQYNRLGNILGNENEMGIIIGIAFIFILYLILYEKKYLYCFYGIIMLPTILLTGSRKAILLIILNILIITFLTNKRGIKNKIKFIIILFLILFISYYVMFNISIFYTVIGRRVENLFHFLSNKGTNEESILMRDYMIRFGFEIFKKRPLLGWGIDNYCVLLEKSIAWRTYAHNNYIELLVGTGLIGTIAFYLIYVDAIKKLKCRFISNNKLYHLFFTLNVSICVLGYALVHYDSKHFYIILAISSVVSNMDEKKYQ